MQIYERKEEEKMKRILVTMMVLAILFSGCTKAGQGISPLAGLNPTPEAVKASDSATIVVAKASAKATQTPRVGATAVQTSGGQYIEANKPATNYDYVVDGDTVRFDKVTGKILGFGLQKADGTRINESDTSKIAPEEIRWSDRMAIILWNGNAGLLKTAVSGNPTWREILNVTIWIARGGLWVLTKDPKVNIDQYTGQVPIPGNIQTVESWLKLVYDVNFNRSLFQQRDSPQQNVLNQLGMKIEDMPDSSAEFSTPESVAKVCPGLIQLAEKRGWGG